MGVRITDSSNVALYDSTTGRAFGPVFESHAEAEDFVRFTQQWISDPRLFLPDEMEQVTKLYDQQRALEAHSVYEGLGVRTCYCGDGDHYRGTKELPVLGVPA